MAVNTWRSEWRRLPARVDIPAEELLRRAPWGQKKNTFGSPKWGPFSASKMGSFSLVFVLEMDPKMGRVWVPIFSTTEFID